MKKKEELTPEDSTFKVGQRAYYIRFLANNGISEILEMNISKIDETCAVGVIVNNKELQHQRWIVSHKYIGDLLFHDRQNALIRLKQLQKESHYVEKKFTVQEENGDVEEED